MLNNHCSFCGKYDSRNEEKMFSSSYSKDLLICYTCIETCVEMIQLENTGSLSSIEELPTPINIKKFLDEYIIGQDEAKITLAVGIYNHYKRIMYSDHEVEIQKSNILIIGPTGSGKTLLAKTIAKALNVPFAISDVTNLTEAGYVGEDVENIVLNLLQTCDHDILKAQNGIIFLDEIDKISRKSDSPSVTRDVSGEGVQQALLKIIEGSVINVPPKGGRKHPGMEMLQIDTSNILFICSGAFEGLDKIIQERSKQTTIGFSDIAKVRVEKLKNIETKDLVRYGIIPELVGRLPIVTTVEHLSELDLIRILTEPKNSIIEQYEFLFGLNNIDLEFTPEALVKIAKLTIEKKTGARGLRAIIEKILLNVMFEIPSETDVNKVIIDENLIPIKIRKKICCNE